VYRIESWSTVALVSGRSVTVAKSGANFRAVAAVCKWILLAGQAGDSQSLAASSAALDVVFVTGGAAICSRRRIMRDVITAVEK